MLENQESLQSPRIALVFGGTSSIALNVFPRISPIFEKVYWYSRPNTSIPVSRIKAQLRDPKIEYVEIGIGELNGRIDVSKVWPLQTGLQPVSVLNFTGFLGEASGPLNFDSKEILHVIQENLQTYLSLMEMFIHRAPSGSIYISFAGAGVGGDFPDDSSLGYLASKGVMCIFNEIFHKQLKKISKYTCLVSPGAFPSRMQATVLQSEASSLSQSRKVLAQEVKFDERRTSRLAECLVFLIKNPSNASGRIWSAQHDDFKITTDANFGKLRRVF